jgi:hypothetical protein
MYTEERYCNHKSSRHHKTELITISLLTFCFDPFGIFLKRAKNQNESKRIKKVSFCKVFEKGVDPFGFWHGF